MPFLSRKTIEELSVTPHVGIGPLKLGMSSAEILCSLYRLREKLSLPTSEDILISQTEETDAITFRYVDSSFFFMARYRDDHAIEIAIGSDLRDQLPILLGEIDVFRTTAEDLIATLKSQDTCLCDMEDEQLSTNYEFPKLGIRLWREMPFHPKLLSDPAYMEEMKFVIDEMYRYLYFEIIAVQKITGNL